MCTTAVRVAPLHACTVSVMPILERLRAIQSGPEFLCASINLPRQQSPYIGVTDLKSKIISLFFFMPQFVLQLLLKTSVNNEENQVTISKVWQSFKPSVRARLVKSVKQIFTEQIVTFWWRLGKM